MVKMNFCRSKICLPAKLYKQTTDNYVKNHTWRHTRVEANEAWRMYRAGWDQRTCDDLERGPTNPPCVCCMCVSGLVGGRMWGGQVSRRKCSSSSAHVFDKERKEKPVWLTRIQKWIDSLVHKFNCGRLIARSRKMAQAATVEQWNRSLNEKGNETKKKQNMMFASKVEGKKWKIKIVLFECQTKKFEI